MLLSVGGFSVPVFVLGYILIYIVSMKLQLLPVQGYRSPFQGLGPFFAHIALPTLRSEEHTSELQSLMRTSYAVFCLKKKKTNHTYSNTVMYVPLIANAIN